MTAYKGEHAWAPCFHKDEDGSQTREYICQVLEKPPASPVGKADLETLLWEIGLEWYYSNQSETIEDLKFSFHADQWVGIAVEIHRKEGEPVYLWTEADSFTLAMAKTIERLKDKGFWPAIPVDKDEENEPADASG